MSQHNRPFTKINNCQPVTALFKGRRRILERLSAYFYVRSGGGAQSRREFLLHGMGGSGKSQIALKFASDFGQR